MTLDVLAYGATRLGIHLTLAQLEQFSAYADLLVQANRSLNLTRITERADIERRHFLDALTCALPCLTELQAGVDWRSLDVGAGGGVPGIPLAIAFPSLRMTLLEATGKKAAFLRDASDRLGLEHINVRNARAEEAGLDPVERDSYDLVVARALAPLAVALEWCLPFARIGGLVVLPRGSDLPAQLGDGRVAAETLAARLRPPIPIELPELPPGRSLVVADKLGPTPARFPRRPGLASQRPLGSTARR
ncbi:MAG: 16S rRNA (guanine(527)-N(7))-methyltransferase RsmG [Chloroflexi bacterium]|nr:16S rRNA (guanine(527)-N(7))-methyltransferase RsmG [Chloroflexota bacterium]